EIFQVFENAKTPKSHYVPFFLPLFMEVMGYISDYQFVRMISPSYVYTVSQSVCAVTSYTFWVVKKDG
ncbi:hypothetical protein, partial [Bacteroides pyogenes]|uniref:hypothetical protein n=1 Tax=Bacteroides pyogenes TaxID=310300 RepID=UPI001F3ACE61